MERISEKKSDDARKFLLEVVDFSKGKTWEELDPTTQQAVINAVANSPLTLDMIKTSLKNSSSKITYETREIGGRTIRFGFDETGKQVSKVDLGASGGGPKDIFAESDAIIKQYKDAGTDRATIEKQYKDAGKAIPIEVQKSLDKLYPVAAPTTEKKTTWWNPLTWF